MKVRVFLLFSRNKKIGSRFISWLTNHRNNTKFMTPSHIALLLNNKWVFESTCDKNVNVVSLNKWKQIHEICHFDELGIFEYQDIANIIRLIRGRRYDFLGAFYLGVRLLLNKFFKLSIGSKNYFESKNAFFCTEILSKIINKNLSMYSPADILSNLDELKNGEFSIKNYLGGNINHD